MASGSFNLSLEHPSSSITFQGKIEWTSVSNGAVANTSLVTCKMYARKQNSSTPTSGTFRGKQIIDGTTFSYSQSKSVGNSWVLIATASKTVSHNANGSKTITISGEVGKVAGTTLANINSTGSSSATLDTIPRYATMQSGGSTNDEEDIWFSINTPAYSSYTKLEYAVSLNGSTPIDSWREYTLGSTPVSSIAIAYTLNATEKNAIYSFSEDAPQITIHELVRSTLNGTSQVDSTVSALSIINAKPEFTSANITYEDINASVVAETGDNQKIVKLKSTPRITWTAPTLKKGATFDHIELSFSGGVVEAPYSSNNSSGSYDMVSTLFSTLLDITATVYDSRGNYTTITKNVPIIDYNYPIIDIKAHRVNNYESLTKLQADVTISSVDSINSIQTLRYRTQQDGTGVWSAWTNITNGTEYTITLDNNYQFGINVECVDKFGSKSSLYTLNKGVFPLFVDVDLNSVGINCFPKKQNSLEVSEVEIAIEEEEIWSGSTLLDDNDSITLDINVSETQRGFAFLWEHTNGEKQVTYAPKTLTAMSINYFLISSGGLGFKRVYLNGNDTLAGESVNSGSGTIGGITYDSSNWYLKKVYRV